MEVRIVDFPETKVATLEHHGPPELEHSTARRLLEWRRQNRMPPFRDFPIFFHYVNVGPAVQEHEMITDVYLPLQ